MLQKEDDLVKKCMEYEVEDASPRGAKENLDRDYAKRLSGT